VYAARCVLRAATVAAEVLQQPALAAQSHTRARMRGAQERAAQAPATVWSSLKPATARSHAEQGAGRTSQSPHCRLLSWALPWSLTWDSVSGALLPEAALLHMLPRPPARSSMQPA